MKIICNVNRNVLYIIADTLEKNFNIKISTKVVSMNNKHFSHKK